MHFPSSSVYHPTFSHSQIPHGDPAAAPKEKVQEQKASAGCHSPFSLCEQDETR